MRVFLLRDAIDVPLLKIFSDVGSREGGLQETRALRWSELFCFFPNRGHDSLSNPANGRNGKREELNRAMYEVEHDVARSSLA